MQNLGYVREGKLGFKPKHQTPFSLFCSESEFYHATQDRHASVSRVLGWQVLEFLPALLPLLKILLHVCRWFVLYVCLCSVHRGQKDHLGLELEMVLSHHVGIGN